MATSISHILGVIVAILLLIAVAGGVFIYSGAYDIGADAPHTGPVHALINAARERSIAVRANGITPPSDLDSPQRVAMGAGLYGEMCQTCHLGPGVDPSELSQGLYPEAPRLAQVHDLSPGEQFWIIKHGIKMTAMPAWGRTHPDPLIWDMVAFIRKLPGMTAEDYKRAVASAPEEHDEMMKEAEGHHHQH